MEIQFNTKRITKQVAILGMLLGLLPMALTAQTYKLDNGQGKVSVTGTSSLHDWEEVAEQSSGSMALERDGESIVLENLNFTVVSESLKSGKSGMDKNTYKALLTDKYKEITYRMKSIRSVSPQGGNGYKVVALGNLTIAGKTNSITLDLNLSLQGDKLTLKGTKGLKMTDYGIDPPKALMGTIKTGDDIVIHFDTVWKK